MAELAFSALLTRRRRHSGTWHVSPALSAELVPIQKPGWEQRGSRGQTSDSSAMSRKTRIPAEAYSPTPHKGIRSLTCLRRVRRGRQACGRAVRPHGQAPRLQKSAVSGRERARNRWRHHPAHHRADAGGFPKVSGSASNSASCARERPATTLCVGSTTAFMSSVLDRMIRSILSSIVPRVTSL